MSASEPGAIVPLRGKRPKIFAGEVDVSSTKRLSEMRSGPDAAVVHQAHPRLDAGRAVRNLREVSLAQRLLLLHAERTVVGGNGLQIVERQPAPQPVLRLLRTQRRAHDVLRALEAGLLVVVVREEQVLRAGLGVRRQSAVARLGDHLERLCRGQVHDVDRHVRHLGQRDGAVRGLRLGACRPRQRVVFGRGLAFGQRLLHQHVDDAAVLGVHADRAAVLARPQQRPEDAARRPA